MRPTIVIHDVLQTRLFSKSQLKAIAQQPMEEWFYDTMLKIPGRVKLAVVAEGISSQQDWVDFIAVESDFEVQCHGWEHKVMHLMSEGDAYEELIKAKISIEDAFNQKVTQFYPPKHKVSDNLIRASHRAGMNVMLDRYRPIHILEGSKFIPEIYIHFWNKSNVSDALKVI